MEHSNKLTSYSACAGCGAKLGAAALSRILAKLPTQADERLLTGYDKSDDASVYQLNDELALVQTVDFFPPIVDDPFLFGQIAAANALSDVYAMGGEPRLAMNIMCVTKELGDEVIYEILRGGYEKANEAGTIISGGHTIEDQQPKYGLAVTGFVHPQRVLTNASIKCGDVLILTKPLGVGVLTTAAKGDMVSETVMRRVYNQMTELNRTARDIMVRYTISACTDVTGFGLLGHAFEMVRASELSIHIETGQVPFHKEALALARMGFVPSGAYRNRAYAGADVALAGVVEQAMEDLLYDPQTSGGLLIAVNEESAAALLADLKDSIPQAAVIGYVTEKETAGLVLE